jgi:alpha/beta hydrolase family protein
MAAKTNRVLLAAAVALWAAGAQARIVEVRIEGTEPFAGGAAFGAAGAYERVWGTATGELDPADPLNRGIVNIARAPRNARGRVEYETDWFMLRPADAAKGNGKIFYEVNNRGRKFLFNRLLDAPPRAGGAVNDPNTVEDAGTALLFRQGWILLWSGWDPDAPKANRGLAMRSPAVPGVVRTIRDELVNGTRGPLRDTLRLSYEAATLDPAQAKLTVRRKEKDAPVEIPAGGWAYVSAREIRLLPEGTRPEPGSLYEMHYPAKDPKVLGIGFAAVRDIVAWFRGAADGNPAGAPARSVLAFGVSQSGRFLRDFVRQGFNRDEQQHRVFDGALAHTAGVGGVFLNEEFGQPARTNTQHEDHTYPENAFPFSAASQVDPPTGKTAAVLRGDGFDPLWMESNTSTEYWQKGASLLHTDPGGQRDVALPPNARVYMIAGTQHGGQARLKADPGPCANPRNPHNPDAVLRALVVALDQWVSEGRRPPESRVPTLGGRTLVPAEKTGFPRLPGFVTAAFGNEIAVFGDWVSPRRAPSPYRTLVPRVDLDGNDIGGIRSPDIAIPLATYTGWNLYKAPFPEGELCDRDGSYAPFAATLAERKARGDPRLAVAERYDDQADYANRVEAWARRLVKDRLLLEEDAERYIRAARDPALAARFPKR